MHFFPGGQTARSMLLCFVSFFMVFGGGLGWFATWPNDKATTAEIVGSLVVCVGGLILYALTGCWSALVAIREALDRKNGSR